MAIREFHGGAAITRGPDMEDNFRDIPREDWPELLDLYRFFCERALPNDCRKLLRMVAEAELVEWVGFGDRDSYLRDGLGLDPKAVDWAMRGLEVMGVAEPVPYVKAQTIGHRTQALAQSDAVPAHREHGTNQHTGGDDNINSSRHTGGTSAAYLVARLKRDHPAIVERMARGEFRSVRAAAIEAGILTPQTRLQIALHAYARLSSDDRETFLREVAPSSA